MLNVTIRIPSGPCRVLNHQTSLQSASAIFFYNVSVADHFTLSTPTTERLNNVALMSLRLHAIAAKSKRHYLHALSLLGKDRTSK